MLIALALAGSMAAQTTVWGGDHIEMEVTSAGARVEFDCAQGTIDARLRPNAKGAFKVKGTFTPGRSGPIAGNEGPRTRKATYQGTIEGDTMTLWILVQGEKSPIGTYTLIRGQRGDVRKCR